MKTIGLFKQAPIHSLDVAKHFYQMNDKEIDGLLNKINTSHNRLGYVLNLKPEDLKSIQSALQIQEILNIDYLENDLKLVVRFLGENKNANIIRLSSRGLKIIKEGGWIKYRKKKRKEKIIKSVKKNASYWFNIIVPILSLLVAYWSIKNDNHVLEDKLNEAQEQQKILNKTQKDKLQMLTKKVDSVLLDTERTD